MEAIEKLKKKIEYRDKQIETLSGTISKSMGVNTRPAHRMLIADHWVLIDPNMPDEMFERLEFACGINSNIIIDGEVEINSHLLDIIIARHGFIGKTDFDKNSPSDKNYTLKIVTYKKALVGELEMHITFGYEFVESSESYKHTSTVIELVQGTEFQEIKVKSIAKLDLLIRILGGYGND